MDIYEVTDEMLDYLIERAIVAHKSPDSTHAYKKLEEAWATIRARRIAVRGKTQQEIAQSNDIDPR